MWILYNPLLSCASCAVKTNSGTYNFQTLQEHFLLRLQVQACCIVDQYKDAEPTNSQGNIMHADSNGSFDMIKCLHILLFEPKISGCLADSLSQDFLVLACHSNSSRGF